MLGGVETGTSVVGHGGARMWEEEEKEEGKKESRTPSLPRIRLFFLPVSADLPPRLERLHVEIEECFATMLYI